MYKHCLQFEILNTC